MGPLPSVSLGMRPVPSGEVLHGVARSLRVIGLQLLLLVALAGASAAATGEVTRTKDAETGLLSWRWGVQGVSIELTQLLPDQTRAFFLGRRFSREATDRIALTRVFQTAFRNNGESAVEYDLNDWAVLHGGVRLPVRTREVWDPEWATAGVTEASRIAFRWALLPTVQRFEPGDYNWGMTSFGLPPGERLDLSLGVRIGGRVVEGKIPGMLCASDR